MKVWIDGANIQYHIVGEGKPVVLLHGFGCDHKLMMGCMEPVFQSCPGYRRIYIDLPGMGGSDGPSAWCGSDQILEVLLRVISKLAEGHFLLVGESYGGYLARGILASMLGERVDGLLLLCPVVIPEWKERTVPEKTARRFDRQFLEQLSEEERSDFCDYAVIANASTYKRYQTDIVPGLQAAKSEFLGQLNQRYAFRFHVDRAIRKSGYDKPSLFIAGRQDVCVGYQDLWMLLKDYPRATYAVLDMAGHNLQIERPELFRSLAADWIARTECPDGEGGTTGEKTDFLSRD